MGDQPVTKIAALTATINGLIADAKTTLDQMVALTTIITTLIVKVDNINNDNANNNKRNNPNSGGGPTLV